MFAFIEQPIESKLIDFSSKEVFSERKQGNIQKAYKMAQQLVQHNPKDSWNHKALAWCLIDLIKQNAEKFGCRNIYPVLGSAPEAMAELPMTDVVIIGGSGGNMHEILNKATNILRPDGRIVLTSVTAETTGEVVNEFKDRPFTFDGFQMQINRLRKLGRYHLFNPMSPIFIFTAIKKEEV